MQKFLTTWDVNIHDSPASTYFEYTLNTFMAEMKKLDNSPDISHKQSQLENTFIALWVGYLPDTTNMLTVKLTECINLDHIDENTVDSMYFPNTRKIFEYILALTLQQQKDIFDQKFFKPKVWHLFFVVCDNFVILVE